MRSFGKSVGCMIVDMTAFNTRISQPLLIRLKYSILIEVAMSFLIIDDRILF